ncbi:DUF3558 domain-containing protein, partial [Pseudonocardia sp. KRD291]|uniref:DUF3558 domain-containing protein n=1 Tax=Pseudonocardia sp. KRD291 TaxID=2792007 RepID=UPI001C49FC3B
MTHRPVRVAVAVVGAVFAAACTPAPAPPDVPVPAVTTPPSDACHPSTELLGPDLVDTAGAEPATTGSGCSWTGRERAFLLRADVHGAGLGAMYRARDLYRAFQVGELDGLPTVVTTPEGDPSCSLHVATSQDSSLTVQVAPAGGPVPDPCATASRA